MNIGSDSFGTFRCDQAMQIGLNMTNLHKIFGAFSNGSISMSADGEDADTVQFIFESAKESAAAKSKRMKVEEENQEDDEEEENESEKEKSDDEDMEDVKPGKSSKKKNKDSSTTATRAPLAK